jgi:hypothetical protein
MGLVSSHHSRVIFWRPAARTDRNGGRARLAGPGLPTRCTVSRVVSFVVPAPQPIVGLSKRLPFHQSG